MEEGKMSRAKVSTKLSVVSGKPTEAGKSHKLSLVDRAMGLHTIHIVFYYRSSPFKEGPMSSELDNLRVTLSQLLDYYPVVTGRLTRGPDTDWVVKCNDAGVRMLAAVVSVSLDEWLRSADAAEERDLTVWEDMPHDPTFWSPFRIQISSFKCGGLAIGLSCSHMNADITSATLLFKSWTQAHRHLPLTHPPIFHLPLPLTINPCKSIFSPSKHPTPKMATTTMRFSAPAIEKCLSLLRNHCPDATPFVVLAALFWSRLARYKQQTPQTSLAICVDSRSLEDSPIPYAYFGNAMNFSVLSMEVDKLMSSGLGQVSDYVHRHIKRDELVSYEISRDDEPVRVYGHWLTCVSVEGRGTVYEAEFEAGERPVHVSCHIGNVGPDGMIVIMPSPEDGLARTVTVTLAEDEMDSLCRDEGILELDPTMVLSGKR